MTKQTDAEPTFGQWLKRRRMALDLTQEALAERVGYACPTLQKIERGVRRPSRALAERLADALEIPAAERAVFLRLARAPVEAAVEEDRPPPSVNGANPPSTPRDRLAMPLLVTKIQPPPVRQQVVPRPRLTRRLGGDQRGLITLVAAPAGWGKTTLIAAWIASLPPAEAHQVAWVALDSSDVDPVGLLRYIIAALQRCNAALGGAALALLDTPQAALEVALTLLINDLAAFPEPITLVLDDYHLLRGVAIHQMLTFLVERMPPQLHLVIATREDPPLPLTRLRARRQIQEIRAADLRFTPDEAAAFLTDAMGVALDAQAIAALEQRTEGWAAGLQFSALALRDRTDSAGFIHDFLSSHRLVLDYLTAEVLDNLPNHLQTFLLQTSILERLCGPLCDAMTLGSTENHEIASPLSAPGSSSYSQLILDELERAHLFLVPLDDERVWYRYHHLFGEVLRARLQRGANPATVKQLHERAATWYATQNLWQEALSHALAAQQWDRAAEAITRIGDDLLLQGAVPRLRELINALPAATHDAHPRLLLLQAMCAIRDNNLVLSIDYLERAVAAYLAAGDLSGYGEAMLHLSGSQRMLGAFATARANLQTALAAPLLPQPRLIALFSRIWEETATGEWREGNAALDDALALAAASNDQRLWLDVTINMHSILLVLPGVIIQAERLLRLAESWPVPPLSPLQAALSWVNGFTRLLRGDLHTATAQINRAIEISTQLGGIIKIETDAGSCQAMVLALQGDLERADQRFGRLFALLEQPALAAFTRSWGSIHRYLYGWLRSQQGRFDEARTILQQMDAAAGPHEWPVAQSARLLLRGLLAIEEGKSSYADELLRQAVGEQQRFGIALVMGDARMLLAFNALRDNREAEAVALLTATLDEHVQRGTPGLLLISGRSIATPLLLLAHAHNMHSPTVERLLHAFGVTPPTTRQATATAPPQLPEALTARELEVLQLLARGASNQAIADALTVSLHTTKSHVAHILAKLGVGSRTEAIARAREFGLISSS